MSTIYYVFGQEPKLGGDLVNLEHVRTLRRWGLDAKIFIIDPPKSTALFDDLPIIQNTHNAFTVNNDSIFVVPEVLHGILHQFNHPNDSLSRARVIMHNQNPFYTFISFRHAAQLNAHPMEQIIVPSAYAARRLREMNVRKPISVVHPYIPNYFAPKPKQHSPIKIALSTRKRKLETQVVLFYLQSHYDNAFPIEIVNLNDISREQVAQEMATAAIFVSFAERESLGLMTLEAMASGCHVVGFSGYTGGESEFINDSNGDWVNEGDYLDFTRKLIAAIKMAGRCEVSPKAVAGLQMVNRHFRQNHFEHELKHCFEGILGGKI